jgi:methionine-rich copper-binding protein CopC
MKRCAVAVLTILLLPWAPIPASAHAFLDRAVPAVGSKVRKSPAHVRLRFTERLEAGFCSVRVLDARGKRVDKGDARGDPSDSAALLLDLKPLPPGTYKVVWRAVSVDGHVTKGDFTFEVAP